MTTPPTQMSAELPCHRCGYDLRAHPQDGKCPECGESVAESKRLAATPLRPAWRDSDPRWRRRMLAGVCVLALLPLMDVLQISGWSSSIPAPNFFDFHNSIHKLDDTFLWDRRVDQPLLFCIGVVLLFSKERGRQHCKLDWTRRWGILCSYVTLLLSAVPVLFLSALVLAGISALFMSMPLKYQPKITYLFTQVGTTYLRYATNPKPITSVALVAFSSVAVLLACVPLFDALRSSGPKRLAMILLAPLALFSLLHLSQVGRYSIGLSNMTIQELSTYEVYFYPKSFALAAAQSSTGLNLSVSEFFTLLVELTKWCIVLSIAVWLSIAQIATWRHRKKSSAE